MAVGFATLNPPYALKKTGSGAANDLLDRSGNCELAAVGTFSLRLGWRHLRMGWRQFEHGEQNRKTADDNHDEMEPART